MQAPRTLTSISVALMIALISPTELVSQTSDASAWSDLTYRLVGPFRAGRTVGAVGVPSQPGVFYIGVNNGGVWKTDDFGRTWRPIFDDAPTGSVGDIAVASSDPEYIYVGTGEGLHRPDLSVGDGVFRSTDGGRTWKHVGLSDVQQIARLIVHPTEPRTVLVAGLGHPYGPNEQRGVFRSRDGGDTWDKVLYIDHNTGAAQVEFDPVDPDILYAVMWEHREGPWENAAFAGANSGLYKSEDGGDTWRRLTQGLPTAEDGLGRIGVGVGRSDSARLYAAVQAERDGGIYRSDDAGETWYSVSDDYRLWGRGDDFAEIRVHPQNADVVFVGNIASYRSEDGGYTWTSIKGAPGGDDYHRIWINPRYPQIMLFAADQGATITVNGGRTWSSWYNQPTAQLYHVSTDNGFPYWVYGGQQESGAIAIASRGPGGQITFREFAGIGADEYAYVAPDPLDPNIVYGGRVVRFNKETGQTQHVAPEALRSGKYRILRTMPLMFHPADPTMLLFATNVLWKTHTGGDSWEIISPDLSREQPDVPESIGDFRTPDLETMERRGVIYAISPAAVDVNTIWAGTDDGLVHVTHDGGQDWADVTPPDLRSWDKVSQIDGGHFDANTAYIAINAIRRDDMRPHIYRTHDGGETWDYIVDGLAAMGPVNVVREDPHQPGLLFAGTEREVYFSVDDGEMWHSLRQNMPASSIRDLVIHENDLIVGTHGRSIFILDDITPLRETARGDLDDGVAHLFDVSTAIRVRWNMFSDTPLPPEEPTGENPPDGVPIDYWLPHEAGEVRLDVLAGDELIRSFSSRDLPPAIDTTALPHPTYWIRPFDAPSTERGHHRSIWDLRYEPPRGTQNKFSIAAVYERTPPGPHGPFAGPGEYTVRLTVDGTEVGQKSFALRLDPRVKATREDIALQTEYSLRAYRAYLKLQEMREAIDVSLAGDGRLSESERQMLAAMRGDGIPGEPDITYGSISESAPENETIVGLQRKFLFMLTLFQNSDTRPTTQAMSGLGKLEQAMLALIERWQQG